jgi:TorA maturation chaperone TorD
MALREEILEEDRYRAQFYRLLSRLLVRAPDLDLLTQLSTFKSDDTAIGQAFGALAAAAGLETPESVAEEYQDLFIGIGRGELVPFASYYLTGFLNEKPLARLRQDMAAHGVARAEGVSEPEDHIASLCEIMAGFILGDFEAPMPLAQQSEFFNRHIGCWAGRFFEDLENAKTAQFYTAVGALGHAFLTIETTAFQMAA